MICHVLVFLPDIFTGCSAIASDGGTLLLVFVPAGGLAGAVAVVGKLTLSTAVKVGLVAEAAMAHHGGQTEDDKMTKE